MIWLLLKIAIGFAALYIVIFWVHWALKGLPARRAARIKADRRRRLATIPDLEDELGMRREKKRWYEAG